MKFVHPDYNIKVDTDDLAFIKHLGKLNDVYKDIPNTKCLKCPNKKNVEADCCKVFSPPMMLVEFLNIFRKMQNKDIDERIEITAKCIDSFFSPEITKKCPFLDKKNLCEFYDQRPFACRMFALYSDGEWSARLESVSKTLGIEKKEVPFFKQCRGIKIEGKKKNISKTDSDNLFKLLYSMDVALFDNVKTGSNIVYNSMTYLPFDSHYLSLLLGPEVLDKFVEIKIALRNKLAAFKAGEITQEEYDVEKTNVLLLVEEIKKGFCNREK